MPGSFIQQPSTGGGGGGGGARPDGVPYSEMILAEPSLRHYYKMDDTPAMDAAGGVIDSKGGVHGTARGFSASAWSYDPANGLGPNTDPTNALKAPDGRSKAPMIDRNGRGGYVDLTDTFGDNFMLGRNPYTVEMWFFVNSFSQFALPRLYSKEGGGNFLFPYWQNINGGDAVDSRRIGCQRGVTIYAFKQAYPVRLNTWHHLVGTYDGDTLSGYADGQLRDSAADAAVIAHSAYVASIGAGGSKGGNETCPGSICHVAFYDTALDSEKIRNHWNDMFKSAVKIV